MNATSKSNWGWIAAAVVASVSLFGLLVWRMWPSEPTSETTSSLRTYPVQPLPVHITADSNPKAALIGTDTSVSADLMRLQLYATSPGKIPSEGIAILGTSPSNPQTYAVGSVLASSATIEEIYSDYIVLRHAGHRSKLYRVGIVAGTDDALVAATTVGGPGMADRPIETRASSQEDYVDLVKAKLVFEDEKVTGFEIGAGNQSHRLSSLGLESGDIIRSIDGNPVVADADWQRVVKALRGGNSVTLGVERQGALVPVLLDATRIGNDSSSGLAEMQTLPPVPIS